MDKDPSQDALTGWLKAQGRTVGHLEPLAGDVSPRRYVRLDGIDGSSAIAAVYPPTLRDAYRRFVTADALLRGVAVRTPHILAQDPEGRFMLLEDLGPETLFDLPAANPPEDWDALLPHYRRAAAILEGIRGLPVDEVQALNPTLDRDSLERELEQTWEVFLLPRRLLPDRGLRRELEAIFAHVCATLGAEPPVPCHRDFMVRNLVAVEAENDLAVLDHQDLRRGPPLYDLASLLNDSLFPPSELEEEILDQAGASGAASLVSYRRAAVQRTFKAVGTFAAFAARGSDRRLPLIPPTLRRGLEQLERLPEGEEPIGPLRRALLRSP
jgi:aminoglycoside/choline kinase family phosphotransferase